MKVLVTGCAGFIGMHVAKRLLQNGATVVGLDNLNDYYNPQLKMARLEQLKPFGRFSFHYGDIANNKTVEHIFTKEKPSKVVNLAAQAGVRYSIINPHAYIQSNIVGFSNILEACRHHNVEHLVYASSSSVYGANSNAPFSVQHNVDHPISLYAATKKSNELMAHTYSHLYGLPTTGLRYFTVYGPWGRPDMAPWLFTNAILENLTIDVFNHGKMQRDFTYIDDVAEGTVRVLDHIPTRSAANSSAPYKVYNIGNNKPIELLSFINILENALDRRAVMNFLPIQPGDVIATHADIEDLKREVGFAPVTSLSVGLEQWVQWFKSFHV